MPPLEALHIHATSYVLDEPHCTRLLNSINWRLLKRLSLFTANPAPFFQAFTSALPSLSSLELALHFTHRDIWPTPESPLTDLSAALAFLTSRTNAVIPTTPQWHPNRTNLAPTPTPLWTTLSTAHSRTLTHLSILPRLPTLAAPFYHPGLAGNLAPFTHLHTLHLALPRHPRTLDCGAHCSASTPHFAPTDYMTVLPHLRSLRALALTVEAPTHGAASVRDVVKLHAHCALRRIWWVYMRAGAALERVEVRFWRQRAVGEVVVVESWRVGEGAFVVRVRGKERRGSEVCRYDIDEEGVEFGMRVLKG
jgi:hypothetical protein